jgi:hypothetical protein
MPSHKRNYWDIGDSEPFRLSKDNCQKLVEALVLCGGEVTSTFTLDDHAGEWRHGLKAHQAAVLIRVSIPEGREDRFREILGHPIEEPPVIQAN